jgi:hypothetical protein
VAQLFSLGRRAFMNKSNHQFSKWAVIQIGIWIIGCALWFYFRTSYILAHLTHPEDNDDTWSFQALAFFIFRLIPAFIGLCMLLTLEHFILQKKGLDDKSSA